MTNRKAGWMLLALMAGGLGMTSSVARADFYKCSRADGSVSFQDVPCQGQEKLLKKQVTPEREPPAEASDATTSAISSLDAASQPVAAALQRRALIMEGLAVASGVKIQVAEYFMMEGKLPSSNAQLGLPLAKEYVRNAIIGLEVQAGGTIVVKYNEKSGVKNGELRLKPDVSKMHMGIAWECLTPSFKDMASWAPGCRYTGSSK